MTTASTAVVETTGSSALVNGRMDQWDLVPGSWEHTLYFEAARALTEQRFSQLKSRHVAGLDH